MDSQNRMIMGHLRRHRSITALQALQNYGCMRLASRIYDLKEEGHKIHKQMIEVGNGKRVASYFLIKEGTQ